MPELADQAQILRCIQRDRDVIKRIQDDLNDILGDVLPRKAGVLNYFRTLHPDIAKFLYYYYTSLSNYQTLGEEYVGIVLSRANLTSPSRFHLLCMVILRTLGPHFTPYILKMWERSLKEANSCRNEEEVLESARKIFMIKESLSVLEIVRNAVFYFTGSFYDLAMWVTGIHYVLVRPWLKGEKVSRYFQILGILTSIYSLVSAIDKLRKVQQLCGEELTNETVTAGSTDSNMYCYLCMDKRKNTSSTPCGHLFCWNCIIDAVRVKNVCPLCREKVVPSRIVLLKNYDL